MLQPGYLVLSDGEQLKGMIAQSTRLAFGESFTQLWFIADEFPSKLLQYTSRFGGRDSSIEYFMQIVDGQELFFGNNKNSGFIKLKSKP